MQKDLRQLAKRVVTLQKRATALDVFTGDRDFLRCPHCGLQEDVDIGGCLMTYSKGQRPKDTGLRFKRLDQRDWVCPRCQTRIPCETS